MKVRKNPGHPLRKLQLEREAREIEEALCATKEGDRSELVTISAIRSRDLQQSLLVHKRDILHFGGYGSDTNELILEDENGNPEPLAQEALLALFQALRANIRVVVLNACFSKQQAEAVTEFLGRVGRADW